ncbi:hypothetical protein PybrP1_007555 [[Pythium] brassicae (nom. inval.)]|nr:hypothetical protein PybrP1_007555 [[Pythium] brassicae (nom. inval.)]
MTTSAPRLASPLPLAGVGASSATSATAHSSDDDKQQRRASSAVDCVPQDVRLRFHWEGYLQKRSDWLKHWETYYFVLRGRALYCYLSEEDARQQPEKSKIKKGKFGFADRVTLIKVWDVEETAPQQQGGQALSAPSPSSSAKELAAPNSSAESSAASLFRFTLETEKGHQLHFRTNSEAAKHVWLQYAAYAVVDYDVAGSLHQETKRLRTNVQDFYQAYEYLYAALCDRVDADLFESSTFASVAPNQPISKSTVVPSLDHAVLRFFSLLSPDVILRSNYLPMVHFAGKYRGYSGVLEFFTRLSQSVRFEHFSVEKLDFEADDSSSSSSSSGGGSASDARRSRVLVVSGRETMQVRYNQTTFMQQWTHKLHFKPNAGGLVSRWEVFGDVVASSVVFKAPGFTTNLTLPSLSERIRESFVGGYVVTINLRQIADVRSRELQRDAFFVRCSLDTNEFEGVWHTEAQSKPAVPIEDSAALPPRAQDASAGTSGGDDALSSRVYIYNQELYLQFDRLSRDDNTILLVEFCREANREVVARTHVNMASLLNHQIENKMSSRRRKSATGARTAADDDAASKGLQSFVLSNDHQSFFGKLIIGLKISSLSAARSRSRRESSHRLSSSFHRDSSSVSEDLSELSVHARDSRGSSFRAFAAAKFAAATSPGVPQEDVMHQFVINGVRYQLAEKYRMVKIVGKGTYGEVIAASDFVNGGTYAIKKLGQFLRHPKVALLALREIKLMNEIGTHPCLMETHELQRPLDYDHFEDLYIIQPLMEMDLCRVIHSKEHLSDDQVQYFIFCDNPVARRFAGRQFLIQSEKVKKVDWQTIFPDANPEALDLLDKLLQFDPTHRITAGEALQHPYVSQWRDPQMEKPCHADVATKLTQFDYSQIPWDPQTLKDYLYEEVMRAQRFPGADTSFYRAAG